MGRHNLYVYRSYRVVRLGELIIQHHGRRKTIPLRAFMAAHRNSAASCSASELLTGDNFYWTSG